MSKRIQKIVIVGGGTAGWLTAGLLAARFPQAEGNVRICLLESPDIPIIGVGEGTWPSMRTTLQSIGVSETDFLRECDASFKQGSKFVGWQDGKDEFYYHPFSLPEDYGDINLANHWFAYRDQVSFADAVAAQSVLCEQGLAPKQITTPEYAFNLNYGYHLDAGKFAQFLTKHCVEKLGVEHVLANMLDVQSDSEGNIQALTTDAEVTIDGDFFVDCTGFHSRLLGEYFGVDKLGLDSILFNDRALAVQVKHNDDQAGIASCTLGNALSCGWVWDIALPTRRGIGYVHSSDFIDEDRAADELYAYLVSQGIAMPRAEYTPRTIHFEPHRRRRFWVNNCVGVGLAAGFVEPLEATALVLVETAAKFLADFLPSQQEQLAPLSRRYNAMMERHWQNIVDFLKLHYVLNKRQDDAYWRAHLETESIPDTLQDKLELWRLSAPWLLDTPHIDALFPAASLQYVLYGMQFDTEVPSDWLNVEQRQKADRAFKNNIQRINDLRRVLPANRELLTKVKEFGFQRV